jgi:hypothetical protein
MKTSQFALHWDLPLVVLPRGSPPPKGVDAPSVEFLMRTGLPRALAYGEKSCPAHLSFVPLERGLPPLWEVLDEPPNAPFEKPLEWVDHFVIGVEWFEGGASPYWCLQGGSGRVNTIDIESDDGAPRLANSSVEHLAETFMVFRHWAKQERRGAQAVAQLRTALQGADPEAWPLSQWSILLDYLESRPVEYVICEADVAKSPWERLGMKVV